MLQWNESPVLISVDSLNNRLKDIEFPAVTLCPDFPPDHSTLAEQVFNLFKMDCNIDDSDCDLIRNDIQPDDIRYGFADMYFNILESMNNIKFESNYFDIDYSNCTTVDGPAPNLPCIFPFEFEGSEHQSCVWNGAPWRDGKQS